MLPIILGIGWIVFIVWFVSTLRGAPWLDEEGNEMSSRDRKHLDRLEYTYH